MAQDPWQTAANGLFASLLGALVTVVLGTFCAGVVVRRIEARRERFSLRTGLITEMTEAASSLYFQTLRYWRAAEHSADGAAYDTGGLGSIREELERQYVSSRTRGQVIENRLGVYFCDSAPKELWHTVMDCLVVLYLQRIGLEKNALERVYEDNEPEQLNGCLGRQHTGLSRDQLRASREQPQFRTIGPNRNILVDQYLRTFDQALQAVTVAELRNLMEDKQAHRRF